MCFHWVSFYSFFWLYSGLLCFFLFNFFIKCFLTHIFVNPIQCLMFLYVALKRSCLIFTLHRMATRQEPHLEALLRMYQIIAVAYCEPLSSPLLESQRAFPPSHRRAFVDAFLSSHLGFTYFVRNFVSFSSILLSEHTYPGAFVMMEYQTGVFLSGWTWVREAAVRGW